jgi:phosphoglycolate phosphatase
MLESVLFDLDGTLVDTAPDFIVAVNQLRKTHHLDDLPANKIAAQVSNGSYALTKYAFDIDSEHSEFAALRQALLDNYLKCLGQHATLYTGLNSLLLALEQSQKPWGVVTNKPLLYAQPLMEKLGLANRCQVLICPEHVSKPKPDPEALVKAAEQLNCKLAACAYIGDHDRDIAAGRAAGMKTIAAAYGYIDHTQNVDHWQADIIAKQPQDIHASLEQLFSCTI